MSKDIEDRKTKYYKNLRKSSQEQHTTDNKRRANVRCRRAALRPHELFMRINARALQLQSCFRTVLCAEVLRDFVWCSRISEAYGRFVGVGS